MPAKTAELGAAPGGSPGLGRQGVYVVGFGCRGSSAGLAPVGRQSTALLAVRFGLDGTQIEESWAQVIEQLCVESDRI